MNASWQRVELVPDRPFGISRGTTETTESVIVELEYGGAVGLGGATPSRFYGESPSTVEAVLPSLLEVAESIDDPHAIQRVHGQMGRLVGQNFAAKAAVDVALFDLVSKLVDLPLVRYLGLDPERSLTSSYTISLAETPRMRRWAEEATRAGYDILKVKLGGVQDANVLEEIRRVAPEATLRVDANGAWTAHEAIRMCEACADHDVELVEQPVPADQPETLQFVRDRSPVPIAADESAMTPTDVPRVAGRADVIVVKLMKCGGIRPAVQAINAAHAHGLEVMLGCMLETNVTIAAAAHLIPLADYADLDGSLLLADDPYRGIPMPEGKIDLGAIERTGTGARVT